MASATPSRNRSGAPLQAYLLHRWDWSESSLIVDLFTRERGRLAAAAKGAKRPYSQLRAVLLPFQRITVTLGRAPADDAGEVHTLRQAEWGGGAPMLGGSALFAGFYANELLMRLLARQDPHPAVFDAYAGTLSALAVGDETEVQVALRAFELWLLRDTGVLPDLAVETLRQQAVDGARRYQLQPEAVLSVPAPDGGEAGRASLRSTALPGSRPTAPWPPSGDELPAIDGAALRSLERALAAADLVALQAACRPVLPALRASLRGLLHYHLGPSALRTRQVLQGVQRLLETSPAARQITPTAHPSPHFTPQR